MKKIIIFILVTMYIVPIGAMRQEIIPSPHNSWELPQGVAEYNHQAKLLARQAAPVVARIVEPLEIKDLSIYGQGRSLHSFARDLGSTSDHTENPDDPFSQLTAEHHQNQTIDNLVFLMAFHSDLLGNDKHLEKALSNTNKTKHPFLYHTAQSYIRWNREKFQQKLSNLEKQKSQKRSLWLSAATGIVTTVGLSYLFYKSRDNHANWTDAFNINKIIDAISSSRMASTFVSVIPALASACWAWKTKQQLNNANQEMHSNIFSALQQLKDEESPIKTLQDISLFVSTEIDTPSLMPTFDIVIKKQSEEFKYYIKGLTKDLTKKHDSLSFCIKENDTSHIIDAKVEDLGNLSFIAKKTHRIYTTLFSNEKEINNLMPNILDLISSEDEIDKSRPEEGLGEDTDIKTFSLEQVNDAKQNSKADFARHISELFKMSELQKPAQFQINNNGVITTFYAHMGNDGWLYIRPESFYNSNEMLIPKNTTQLASYLEPILAYIKGKNIS